MIWSHCVQVGIQGASEPRVDSQGSEDASEKPSAFL